MSVMMTSTCIPSSNARCSASVSAERGVMSRSTDGSSARLRNIATLCSTPERSNESMKNRATSCLTPMAANTMANSTSSLSSLACRAIWAAMRLCGRPLPEKMGSFCPRTSVFIRSMDDTATSQATFAPSRFTPLASTMT